MAASRPPGLARQPLDCLHRDQGEDHNPFAAPLTSLNAWAQRLLVRTTSEAKAAASTVRGSRKSKEAPKEAAKPRRLDLTQLNQKARTCLAVPMAMFLRDSSAANTLRDQRPEPHGRWGTRHNRLAGLRRAQCRRGKENTTRPPPVTIRQRHMADSPRYPAQKWCQRHTWHRKKRPQWRQTAPQGRACTRAHLPHLGIDHAGSGRSQQNLRRRSALSRTHHTPRLPAQPRSDRQRRAHICWGSQRWHESDRQGTTHTSEQRARGSGRRRTRGVASVPASVTLWESA